MTAKLSGGYMQYIGILLCGVFGLAFIFHHVTGLIQAKGE